jgi:hypothetical protein
MLILAAGILLAAIAGVAVSRLGGGCGGTMTLKVAADPAVAPAINTVAHRFNREEHTVGDACVEVIANTVSSPGMATALGGDRAGGGQAQADAYILDSSLWLAVAAQAAQRTGVPAPTVIAPVASSPVVFARPKNAVQAPGALTWRGLGEEAERGRYAFRVTEPQNNAAGMIALLMARQAAGDRNAPAGFTRILQDAQPGDGSSVPPHSVAALDSLGTPGSGNGGRVPVVAVPEQAVWVKNAGAGPHVEAVAPADHTLSMDFPLVVTSKKKAEAARRLAAAITSEAGAAELAKVGLRPAGGAPARAVAAVTGLTARVAEAPRPSPQSVLEVLEMWRRMHLGTRMLALIDVSGSMNEMVPGTGRSRMSITAGEIDGGMALLPDAAEVGVWTFSTGMQGRLPYRELSPIGRLGGVEGEGTTHRASLQRLLGGIRAKPDGDTGLHDSVLAAFRAVKAGYRADMLNFVLVLTDGRNDFAGGISEQVLMAELKKEYDPARPVQVIGLAFGPDVDLGALRRISAATGGAAYQIQDARQIRELFRRSATLKICDDPRRCPAG